LPGRLLFVFRIRFGLYSVLARIGAVRDWRALEERFTLEVTRLPEIHPQEVEIGRR